MPSAPAKPPTHSRAIAVAEKAKMGKGAVKARFWRKGCSTYFHENVASATLATIIAMIVGTPMALSER